MRRLGIDIPGVSQALSGISGVSGISVAFNHPVHAERVALLFTRTFTELQGVTDAMSQSISRILAQGLLEGKSPRIIAKELNKQVSGIGIKRSQDIAHTEIIRAHHLGNVAEYRLAGIEGVEVIAEFLTAGDTRVCIICADLAGKRFTLDEVEFLIPLHVRCRCSIIPITKEFEGQKRFQTPEQIKKIAGL